MPIGVARTGVRSLLGEHYLSVRTTMVADIKAREATLWGELVSLGPFDEADVAFEITTTDDLLSASDRLGSITVDSPTFFKQTVDIEPDTAYQFRAVAISDYLAMSVSTDAPDVSADSATLHGSLDSFDRMSGFDHGAILEFRARPLLGVETHPPEEISSDSATLAGELTDYYL